MSNELILAIDQGTTNTKALLVNREGQPIFRASAAVELLQPRPGFIEQDPIELWQSVCSVIGKCTAHAREIGTRIEGIAISNQRETALVWRPETDFTKLSASGAPVTNAISWQCRRSAPQCERLSIQGSMIRRRAGLPLDPLVTAGKWAWVFETWPELLKAASAHEIYLGTVDSWIIYNLTRGRMHVTDHSNASRTALLNLDTLQWDDELLDLFGIPRAAMPQICPSSGQLGLCTAIHDLLGVPIVAVVGDSHAALVAHGHYSPGTIKATYGTGSSLMTLTQKLTEETEALARTVAWSTADGAQFALEGNIAMTGSAVQWVGEFLGLSNPAMGAVALAETVRDANGVVFVPAMVGLGAPYWDHNARGTITNLGRSHTAAHLARAALDAIAYQVADVFFAMEQATGISLPRLLADGGATRNDTLMQFQADLLSRPVHRSSNEELSALGAARLGGLTLGWWDSVSDLGELPKSVQTFEPKRTWEERDQLYSGWRQAVRRARLQEESSSGQC
jgi:glycerol kinase